MQSKQARRTLEHEQAWFNSRGLTNTKLAGLAILGELGSRSSEGKLAIGRGRRAKARRDEAMRGGGGHHLRMEIQR